ncbi:hypothetical protein JCM6882_007140 [Rhodosporidiobolus microsporus]
MTSTTLSLEPLKLYANDGKDEDLFAKPVRLHDVLLEDGSEVLVRGESSKKPLSERLMRVWAERGDYSRLTAESILNPTEEEEDAKEDEDPRPSVEDMRKLQESMLHNLSIARGELTTALDLLSVLSAPTDPPDIDPNALPLPQQTLTFVPTAVPPPASSDPAVNPLATLPLATSLDVLKSSASAFFRASEELIPLDEAELAAVQGASAPSPGAKSRPRTRAPDPWPTILQLHATSPRTLLPLGALPGATLTGKGETRSARQVGVFFGCQEAKDEFRGAAVARVGELVEEDAGKRTGRKLVIEVEAEGRKDRAVWDEVEGQEAEEGVEKILRGRGRAAFAEELFAQLSNEARADASLRAQINLGNRSEGDTVQMEGNGWTLRLTMIVSPPTPTPSSSTASLLLPVIRLLYLQEFAARRSASPPAPRPLLSTLTACLNYLHRFAALEVILQRLFKRAQQGEVDAELEVVGASGKAGGKAVAELFGVLKGRKELGGRIALRVGKSHLFHVFHSYPLPSPSAASNPAFPPPQPTLTLRIPHKAPIPIPSLRHLETFLEEQVDAAVKVAKALRRASEEEEEMEE